MDHHDFDSLAKAIATSSSRRRLLTALVGGVAGGVLGRLGVAGAAPAGCKDPGKSCGKKDKCCGGGKCQGGKCGCPAGKKVCQGKCIPKNHCCDDRECGAGGECKNGSCKCKNGRRKCGSRCIPLSDACTVVVSPDDLHGWTFRNDQADGEPEITPDFVDGPGNPNPPIGDGSARFVVTNAEGKILSARIATGTRLEDITTLKYTTRTNAGTTAPSLQLGIDFHPDDDPTTYNGRLVWVPTQFLGENITLEQWKTWDPLTAEEPAFFFTRFANPFTNGRCTHGNLGSTNGDNGYCTFDEILNQFPDIRINPDNPNGGVGFGFVGFKVGSGEGDVTAFVDAIELAVGGGGSTIFDFEP